MASEFDPAEFVDSDFLAARKAGQAAPGSGIARAPSPAEMEARATEKQQRLAELKRLQEGLERERAGLEEIRRRQIEFQTGRQEAIQNLTRGIGLLEEAEFTARCDAEQMSKSLAGIRDALAKVQSTNEASWTSDNLNTELTRALTIIENARMEWNSARLKFPVLSGVARPEAPQQTMVANSPSPEWPQARTFGEWCKLGFALTWPIALVVLLAVVALGILIGTLVQTPVPHR